MSLIEGSGWGIVSRVPGVGNRPPGKKKTANFRGYVPGGGGAMVTAQIESCVNTPVTTI